MHWSFFTLLLNTLCFCGVNSLAIFPTRSSKQAALRTINSEKVTKTNCIQIHTAGFKSVCMCMEAHKGGKQTGKEERGTYNMECHTLMVPHEDQWIRTVRRSAEGERTTLWTVGCAAVNSIDVASYFSLDACADVCIKQLKSEREWPKAVKHLKQQLH